MAGALISLTIRNEGTPWMVNPSEIRTVEPLERGKGCKVTLREIPFHLADDGGYWEVFEVMQTFQQIQILLRQAANRG
jgi:hypothetical protein